MTLMARSLAVVLLLLVAMPLRAGDRDDLTTMLHEFLANVGDVAAHERFWADELIYTSSAGERTSKATILKSVAEGSADDKPGPTYTAEAVDVRVYGDTAIVAFMLVATAPDSTVTEYYNTGTFLKRGGAWQVVAWQATRLPER